MRVTDVMTPNPETVHPDDTLQAAAQRMDDLNVGVVRPIMLVPLFADVRSEVEMVNLA
jgi:CBS domain-containing protein